MLVLSLLNIGKVYAESVKIDIGNKDKFTNTIKNIRDARKDAVQNGRNFIDLRYQTDAQNGNDPARFTYLRMRVSDFYITNYAINVRGGQSPNYNNSFPTQYQNRDRITPTLENVRNALQNPDNNNSAELIGHLFAEAVRSNTVRNLLTDNLYRNSRRTLGDLGELVNTWAGVSREFNITTTTNDFRPLNTADYVEYANNRTQDNIHRDLQQCLSAMARTLIALGLTEGLLRDCHRRGRVSAELPVVPTTPRIIAQSRAVEITSPTDAQVEIFTYQGALVTKGNVSKEQPASLPIKQGNGLYLVLVKDASGRQTIQKVYIMD